MGERADAVEAVGNTAPGGDSTKGNVPRGRRGETSGPKRDRRNTAREARERARKATRSWRTATLATSPTWACRRGADLQAESEDLSEFFEEALAAGEVAPAVALANWIVNDLLREVKDESLSALPMKPEQLAALVALREEGTISQPVAKEIFSEMVERGVDPRAWVKEKGLEKIGDIDAIKPLVIRSWLLVRQG